MYGTITPAKALRADSVEVEAKIHGSAWNLNSTELSAPDWTFSPKKTDWKPAWRGGK